ncbi:putative inositol-3-phosphate synthase [Clavispora lusitaniae]|uniref:Inositol-3-phosphate synthase n=1 Tax=Clavispora lusitaniae TaxID=36911 RepID=A0ACD0WSQ7_CLALS|nr:Myo-inositol-1-phosphate synthase [Clavispora lusitaniae]QFZ30431.1 putative inositol-3-phosphate synthase [Clavispora lusitaniae]QFZ36093.1 putative inositol-3-phosphate synthase [Clavispora lusitaniae]QFZ41777.1 putative inositol-3-phosphate synthase [Clavispora lusitaniae]QFZ47453.1 putative inositol-3-phosphate synthase [Clavispora lusitaniae]
MSVDFNTNAVSKDGALYTKFTYESATVEKQANGKLSVTPTATEYEFKVDLSVPKTGLMLVGLGGNNGTTMVAATLANKHNISFENKEGVVKPNYYGSVTQSSTIKLGVDKEGNDVYAPFNSILPFVHPNDLVIGGWDISKLPLDKAMKRAKVLDHDLQRQLVQHMDKIVPLPSVYYPDFIAMNQKERADNVFNVDKEGKVTTGDKWKDVERIRSDIQKFKKENGLDKVIVLWTANTERYSDILSGVNDTADNLLKAIKDNHDEVSPSTVFAVACILEQVPYINGSPQNTFVPGAIELAEKHQSFIGGDDFKSGQTKVKSVLAQFLVDAGIKPLSIASYNHLGNNDGFNLSAPKQFRSKEISKQSVVDDMIESNEILYNEETGNKVDHCIVIKYLPAVGDSKVAMDEYYSELMLGGHNKISIHNVCEDSLLATPLIIDLVVMTEFFQRVTYKKVGSDKYESFYSVLTLLSYWLKAPLAKPGFKAINGLNKQRLAVENLLRLLVGMPINNELRFEERLV